MKKKAALHAQEQALNHQKAVFEEERAKHGHGTAPSSSAELEAVAQYQMQVSIPP